jgi:phosphatidylserine/phosphatidylglycerophosphate/cardiolipin synthase-like enzyme
MGYSFTSPEVTRSLIAAKRRGVDIRVVLDQKANTGKASVAAMNVLVSAGNSHHGHLLIFPFRG